MAFRGRNAECERYLFLARTNRIPCGTAALFSPTVLAQGRPKSRAGGNMYKPKYLSLAAALLVGAAVPVAAQQLAVPPPPTTPYGSPIGLEAAKKAMAAAEAEAMKNNWAMAIVIL